MDVIYSIQTITNSPLLHLILGNNQPIAQEKQVSYLQLCIDNGLDINKKDTAGNTPLHMAVATKSKSCFEMLLDNGVDPNIVNNKDESAYSIALLVQRNMETIKTLNNSAPIVLEIETKQNRSIFYEFIKSLHSDTISEKEKEILLFLAENGADINHINTGDYDQKETVFRSCSKKELRLFY